RAALDLLLHGSRPDEIAEARAEFDRAQAHYELLHRGTRSSERAAAEAAVALAPAQLAEAEAALRVAAVTAAGRGAIVAGAAGAPRRRGVGGARGGRGRLTRRPVAQGLGLVEGKRITTSLNKQARNSLFIPAPEASATPATPRWPAFFVSPRTASFLESTR